MPQVRDVLWKIFLCLMTMSCFVMNVKLDQFYKSEAYNDHKRMCQLKRKDSGNSQRKATQGRPYRCKDCVKAFTRIGSLRTRMSLHTRQKPFKCPKCDKAFRLKISFDHHMYVHTGYKPYKCETCNKHFRTETQLNCHLRVHTVERPYDCKFCDKAFK